MRSVVRPLLAVFLLASCGDPGVNEAPAPKPVRPAAVEAPPKAPPSMPAVAEVAPKPVLRDQPSAPVELPVLAEPEPEPEPESESEPESEPESERKLVALVDKIDAKAVGLDDLLKATPSNGGLAAIMADKSGISNKLALAMDGAGSEFVIGHGSGGLGFSGSGTGGGGSGGMGRIQGMGSIDTGGGLGVKSGLGAKKAATRASMKFGALSMTGFCKKSAVKSVVRRRAAAIRACYERRLQANPKLGGKVGLRWTVQVDGKVAGAALTSTELTDSGVRKCVERVVRRMRFPKPEAGICVVRQDMTFSVSSK